MVTHIALVPSPFPVSTQTFIWGTDTSPLCSCPEVRVGLFQDSEQSPSSHMSVSTASSLGPRWLVQKYTVTQVYGFTANRVPFPQTARRWPIAQVTVSSHLMTTRWNTPTMKPTHRGQGKEHRETQPSPPCPDWARSPHHLQTGWCPAGPPPTPLYKTYSV